jgi:uncharacterized protein
MSLTVRGAGRPKRAAALAALTGGAVAASVVFAAAASAHVKVSGIDAVQGGAGVITFRVPSESDTASTNGLVITFPVSTPFTEVDTQPMAGWKATVVTRPLARPLRDDDGNLIKNYVYQVRYRAASAAAGIRPGQFNMFNLSVGPFPRASSMTFSVLQAYSDGSTVNWDERSANGTEPEHPAPVLQLAPAARAGAGAAAGPAAAAAASDGNSGGSSSWPGIAGLIAGIAALLASLAALAVARGRRGAGGAPPA